VRRRILETRLVSEEELRAIDADIRRVVIEAAEFAQNDPEPDPKELWTDVLVGA
jgi:pyruvate dehydrogenase E1 component alpha subunit